jgi:hypothetical protein
VAVSHRSLKRAEATVRDSQNFVAVSHRSLKRAEATVCDSHDDPRPRRSETRRTHVNFAADLLPTITGIAFWTVLLALWTALFGATIVSIVRAPLDRRSRTRWIWLVVLVPGVGIVLWFTSGRKAHTTR